jgi:hypothetical protein
MEGVIISAMSGKQQSVRTEIRFLSLLFMLLFLPFSAFAELGTGGLVISEVMAASRVTVMNGRTSDWIELYNSGDRELDLAGFGISDMAALPYRAVLSGTLAPGAYLLLEASGEGLGFSLSREGERVVLTSPSGETADEISYENLPFDASLAFVGEKWLETWRPTPGGPNEAVSRDEAETSRYLSAKERGILISEVMAANGDYGAPEPVRDWVELYNPSGKEIRLKGLYLSDTAADLKKWPFPEKASLRGKGRALVYCTDDPVGERGSGVYLNGAFKIDKSNGAVILSDGETIIDCVSLGQQFAGVSYGRPEGQGAFRFFNQASPQKPNPLSGCRERVDPVSFSVTGGFKEEPFPLTLDAPLGAEAYYTLDGSEPDDSSLRYTEPLLIGKNTVVRAMAKRSGLIDSPVMTGTYLLEEPLPYPVVCLAGEERVFFGGSGIFEKDNYGPLDERAVNVEIFEDGSERVNQPSGIRLTGGTSRVFLPRTFSLFARAGLSESSFRYNPFPDRGYFEYSSFTLRNGGTDAYRARIRDDFMTHLASGYGLMYLSSRPAAVYVNGQFWAALSLRERANKDSIAQWEGISDPEAINGITIVKNRGEEVRGSKAELEELAAFCRGNDLNDPDKLAYVLSLLDTDSLFAHTAFEIIAGNNDLRNVRYYKIPGGKWKLMLFDLDLGMINGKSIPLDFFLGSGKAATNYCYGELFTSLMQVPEMKDRFLTLIGRILLERFTKGAVTAELDVWKKDLAPLMQRNAGRWKDFSYSNWVKAMESFRGMLVKRPALVVKYLVKGYSLSQAESERYFGAFSRADAPAGAP